MALWPETCDALLQMQHCHESTSIRTLFLEVVNLGDELMALTITRIAFAWIALMLIVPIVIASMVVACLVYPCAWLSVYKIKRPRDLGGAQSDHDNPYGDNQLPLARVWEIEGR